MRKQEDRRRRDHKESGGPDHLKELVGHFEGPAEETIAKPFFYRMYNHFH